MHTHPLRKVAISTTQKNGGCHTATIFSIENVFKPGKKERNSPRSGRTIRTQRESAHKTWEHNQSGIFFVTRMNVTVLHKNEFNSASHLRSYTKIFVA